MSARTLLGFLSHSFTAETFFLAIGQFTIIFVGSLLYGVVLALLSGLVLKHTTLDQYAYLETAIIMLFGYASYLLAEGSSLSGIVAILFCGIVQAQYAWPNLSEDSKVQFTKQG